MRFSLLLISSALVITMMSCATATATTVVNSSPTKLASTSTLVNATPPYFEISTPTALANYIEGQKLVQELLENNAGCKLPCWWGITPGKTTWMEARQILEKVSFFIGGPTSGDVFDASVQVLPPYPYSLDSYMGHLYGVKNGVVDYIRVYNIDLAPNYYLVNLLETYGEPNEVWIRTFSKEDMGIQLFMVDVFYQNLGILIEYSTGNPLSEVGNNLQNCMIKEMDSPFIHLWSPEDQNLSFQEAKKFINTTTLPNPKPLLEATGMDVKTFYETFKNPETDVCLETPKNLWP